jgi:serine/threonine protein phosphatase PrpC
MANTEVQVGAETDVGMVRDHNEDNLGYKIPDEAVVTSNKGMLFLVADGMGGHAAGEVASQIAVETILDRYFSEDTDDIEEALNGAIVDANDIIHAQSSDHREQSGMGTTSVVAVIRGDELTVANVGDSRAYLIRGGEIQQITQDHSWVQEQVRLNLVTPEEAKHHPLRNIITRALGTAPEVKVDFSTYKLQVGDTIILCSDGLSGVVSDGDILEIVTKQENAEMAAKMLINAANAGGGPDNISTIVVRVEKVEPGPERVYKAGRRDAAETTTVTMRAVKPPTEEAQAEKAAPEAATTLTAPAAVAAEAAEEAAPEAVPVPGPPDAAPAVPRSRPNLLLRSLVFIAVAAIMALVTAAIVLVIYLIMLPQESARPRAGGVIISVAPVERA